jgi:hypothetical protein
VGGKLLAFFKRGRTAGSQIGVFVTADGVAVAQIAPRGAGKPRIERCIYEKLGTTDKFGRDFALDGLSPVRTTGPTSSRPVDLIGA